MVISRRRRVRVILALILCLLFQQAAIAAYACTMPIIPPDPVVMAEDCEEMGKSIAQEATALCAKHCAPDVAVAADHVVVSVPMLALPPVGYSTALATPVSHVALVATVPVERSDPPVRLRYCSLLI